MKNKKIIGLKWLSLTAIFVAWMVIGLGAFTRLMDAGLGCPDWPGCYGRLSVPHSQEAAQTANRSFPQTPLVKTKAWAEMIHRYFAGTFAVLVMAVAGLSAFVAVQEGFSFLILGMLLFGLVIYQALLGMWTVTLKLLPIVVSQHLLGGMALLALLWLVLLKSWRPPFLVSDTATPSSFKPLALIGLLLIILQIALGAWTSTNYAALVCPGFPFCKAASNLHVDFRHAFTVFSPIGINYEGGNLSDNARMTIQMTHRFGAFIVTAYFIFLAFWVQIKAKNHAVIKRIIHITLALLAVQIILGTLNALFSLPLVTAIGHNLCATILLLCLISLNYAGKSPGYELNCSLDGVIRNQGKSEL